MQQAHLSLLNRAATLTVVTMWAGSHQVYPGVLSSQVAGDDMVDGQCSAMLPAVLAGEIVAAQHLALGQLDARTRAMNHLFETDDGGTRIDLPNCLNLAASIEDQAGFSINYEGNRTACVADIDRLEVGIKNQYWGLHNCL